ncbi:anti-sigma factor RsbA family regulatory protein [Dactylosporangium sp. CS-047395]|uniref:anti-sigma factor RsbA family regulatory protein n=1 Tax=Dactylosporangium sp. CS-047395 TaxID=3239936 RepID=UPI003D8E795B
MTDTRFAHTALLYASAAEYLDTAVTYVRAARDEDRPVLVAVRGADLERIRDGVGPGGDVTFWDAEATSRNPGRIIPALLDYCARHPGRRPALLGQPMWVGRTGAERSAVIVHEALVNAALAGVDGTALCPYDISGLHASDVDDARRTHPHLTGAGVGESGAGFAPTAALAEHNRPLPAPAHAAAMAYDAVGGLRLLRRAVAEHAAAAGLPGERAADLEFVVTELATNTLRHTSGGGTLHLWTDGETLVCQVTDGGHLLDPLAGRLPVDPTSERGRGLLLTHQMCDLVQVRTDPSGTTIRVHMGH